VHDPDDDFDGDQHYWLGMRGDYPSLLDYPLANIVDIVVAESPTPDQLHIHGPEPNEIPVGTEGTIDAVVQTVGFVGLPNREVMFTKVSDAVLTGSYTFTSGTVSPDGTQATVTTDHHGTAQMTFVAEGVGQGLIEVRAGSGDLTAYSFFTIQSAVQPPPDGDKFQDVGSTQDAEGLGDSVRP
jgi:hypothetical protein